MKRPAYILLLGLFSSVAFAQGEIDDQEKIFYRNERTYGAMLNTNGFGFNFRYGKRIDAFRNSLYEIEMNYLKHPKEVKSTVYTNSTITLGKTHTVYTLKGSLGYQKEMFQKQDLGGISVRYFTNAGPTFAISKPIYYQYEVYNAFYDTYPTGSDPDIIPTGKAPFIKGLDEISVSPGLHAKAGFTFEYGKADEIFHALEAGIGLEAYLLPVEIMHGQPHTTLFVLPDNHFIFTLFISYRFGKVIDARFNQKRNRFDRMLAK